ncbi:hypothetical protein [Sneathiella sp. HT1-7]|uniref:hypothetical protein n=1 Tax=Sneathiella sp. HT1-7 TaxID=2887192 RepID=UPI001D143E1C|nr:hypothetical protein [Sneathiella sp. HT1-7]MCC3303828.1 hypothetical protein [Sneathiella sp. HT1-7]
MLDNLFKITFNKLDRQSLYALADYLEVQASILRRRAEDKEAEANGRRDRIREINKAGRDALEYFFMGVDKELAIQMAASENDVPSINVAANMKRQLQAEQAAIRKKQSEEVIRLRGKNVTVRKIAKALGISPSRVSQIYREKADAAKSLKSKGNTTKEIADTLDLSIPCVSEILR